MDDGWRHLPPHKGAHDELILDSPDGTGAPGRPAARGRGVPPRRPECTPDGSGAPHRQDPAHHQPDRPASQGCRFAVDTRPFVRAGGRPSRVATLPRSLHRTPVIRLPRPRDRILGADAAEMRDAGNRGTGSTMATEACDVDPLAVGSRRCASVKAARASDLSLGSQKSRQPNHRYGHATSRGAEASSTRLHWGSGAPGAPARSPRPRGGRVLVAPSDRLSQHVLTSAFIEGRSRDIGAR
jgi:hypothetical protein